MVLRASGFPQSWNDYQCIPYAFPSGASAPDLITIGPSGNIQGYGFDGGNTTEQLYGQIEILHEYKEESPLYPHVHWSPTTSAAGNVKWFLDYQLVTPMGTIGAPTTISVVAPTNGAAWQYMLSEFPAPINATGIKIGALFSFRLYRVPTDSQDTYGADAALFNLGLHCERDTPGSSRRFLK